MKTQVVATPPIMITVKPKLARGNTGDRGKGRDTQDVYLYNDEPFHLKGLQHLHLRSGQGPELYPQMRPGSRIAFKKIVNLKNYLLKITRPQKQN